MKQQIMEFNKLLSDQVNLMGRLEQAGIASLAMPNGSHGTSSKMNFYTDMCMSSWPYSCKLQL